MLDDSDMVSGGGREREGRGERRGEWMVEENEGEVSVTGPSDHCAKQAYATAPRGP